MKNILENKFWWAARSFVAVVVFGVSVVSAQAVFISEYGEGSSNNKWVEIYNGTGQDVDLSGYAIWKIANGGDWAEGQGNNADLSGTLAAGDVFILCHSSSDAAILAEADITGTQASNFNGDDAVGLAHNGTVIDMVGTHGDDPGSAWGVAGVSNATANHTLVRKASVANGNTDWASSAGTDAESSEWVVHDSNYWDDLGSHTMDPPPTGTDVTFTVTDESESYVNIKYKGTATGWANVQMHDDGTGGDATAGDHVWTVVLNVEDGDHAWGAIEDDGSENGLWLIVGENRAFSVADGVVTGETDYTIEAVDVTANLTFKVVDHTQEIQNLMFKGTMSMWAVFQGYDDGTNGDEIAGDHVWTAQYEAAAGAHEWGAIKTDNGDGTTCVACDGTDGWGTWLLPPDSNQMFTVGDDGSVEGSTSFDVGTPPSPFAGTWVLAPIAGALKTGGGINDGGWWSSPAEAVVDRACLFDDQYIFHEDGTFENVLETETWLEPWQGTDPEACGTPVAPHDGSGTASWSFDEEMGTITLSGTGAYLGLAKAITGAELSNPADAPESITYNILFADDEMMAVYISSGSGYWTFMFARPGVTPSLTVDVTFNIDMSNVTMSSEGVYLAGGGLFGSPGDNPMTLNADLGENVYTITKEVPKYYSGNYIFTNGACGDWGCKENLAGQECADAGSYNDRIIETWDYDMTITGCFETCGEALCADIQTPDPVTVYFELEDTNVPCGDSNPYVTGTFDGWSGWGLELTHDGLERYSGSIELMPGTYDYKFVCGGWTDQEDVPAECGADNGLGGFNRQVMVAEGDDPIHLAPTQWGGCPAVDGLILVEFDVPSDNIPCDGNPYVTGTFDGWSGWGLELIDDDGDGWYYGSIELAPGTYDYKFVCGGWSAQEDVPAECGADNGLGGFNRQVVVSDDEADCWSDYYYYEEYCSIYIDDQAWGQCPPPDFCDVFDCVNKLHAIVLVDTSQYDFETMEVRMTGPWWEWNPSAGPVATWQEFWDPEDAEWTGQGGFFHVQFDDMPIEEMEYLWVINGETELNQLLAGDDLSCIPYTDNYSYATRAWHPDDCAPDDYEDYDPIEDGCVFADIYGGCWEDDEEPELTITSYAYSVQTLDSYNNGDDATTVLPSVDVNDGLHTVATFDTVGLDGPYAGLYALFYDANFNGELDSEDFNVLEWSDDFGNDEDVMLLVDNGPLDMNPDPGVFETMIYADSYEGTFLTTQGATYFMTAIGPDGSVSDYTAVSPVSSSTNRVTGVASMIDPDTGDPVGVPGMSVGVWDWYTFESFGSAITGPDGSYDMGVDITEETLTYISAGEAYEITDRYLCVFDNGGWSGYGGTWISASIGAAGYVQHFDVIKLNTLVHGQVTDQGGSPVGGTLIQVTWHYSDYYSDGLDIYLDADDEGYYSFWGMNGETVDMWANDSNYNYDYYYEEVYIFSDTYDDYIGGYYFNHDIMLVDQDILPETQLISNYGFEEYYQGYGWNSYADGWGFWPSDWNMHIELTGAEIFGSDEPFTAYGYPGQGEASLKMWGQYNSVNNQTDYFQSFDNYIEPGAMIHASAHMMSHPGDWIGKLDDNGTGLNSGQVFVAYFDYYGSFLGIDLSEPMDSSDAAGEWHHRQIISEVPDGAYSVNIGVRYNQVYDADGNAGHGSIYYDNVQAYTGANDVHTVYIDGMAWLEGYDEYGNNTYMENPLPNAPIYVYNGSYFIEVMSDEYGYWSAEVPAYQEYYVTGGLGPDDGIWTSSFETIYACDSYDYYYYCDTYVDIVFTPTSSIWFDVNGQVTDASGNPLSDTQVGFNNDDTGQHHYTWTDYMGYFSISVPYGMYDVSAQMSGYMTGHQNGVDVTSYGVYLEFTLEAAELTGAAEGVVVFHGNPPEEGASVWFWNDNYSAGGGTNSDGFYSVPLPDGIYDAWAGAPNYDGFYQEAAFEIAGNTVIYNVDLYEEGFALAPQIVDLHDVPNDQGRQMRSVWNAGMPGNWEYFTQFSIWRKVNGAPIELWDYVETVPWHGMDDPYAAVVPTLGDSSVHGIYESTFMVTAHTEDIDIWFDSQPVSGYSIDNLHPGIPMSLVYSHDPGAVSLSWSGPEDEDFSHHNIYRQDIASSDPAVVFTTVDSFYVDQDVTDAGAYEYWVTAVDLSGLESEASNSVSAVLSADENLGLPTVFALSQNYPNPFNPSTQIQYALPEETRVVISIYDLMGRKVRTLVNDVQNAGYRSVMWNATNDMGRLVSAGVYIYSIQAGDFVQNRKMVLMK